jgi:hypothetical protein
MKKFLGVVLGAAMCSALLLPATPAGADTAYCGIHWGSGAKSALPSNSGSNIVNARVGKHACFDRLVIDLQGASGVGYNVRYVNPLRNMASGAVVPLSGGAKLEIIIRAPAYNNSGTPTFPTSTRPVPSVAGFRTFRQLKFVVSFEGLTQFGLGVAGRLPFTVTRLANPRRVVIDVAHRWCTGNGPC